MAEHPPISAPSGISASAPGLPFPASAIGGNDEDDVDIPSRLDNAQNKFEELRLRTYPDFIVQDLNPSLALVSHRGWKVRLEARRKIDQSLENISRLRREFESVAFSWEDITKMSSTRNKPRGGPIKEDTLDAHEEQAMWLQIKRDIEKCSQIQKRQKLVGVKIGELQEEFIKDPPSSTQIGELQNLYREMAKLTGEEQSLLNEEPADILKNLSILTALRTASKEDSEQRASSTSKSRKPKTNKVETEPVVADSPGPSPGFASASRLKGSSVRSGSVVSARGGEIKVEEGFDGKGANAERAGKFHMGAEVAYKQARMKEDGSQWIICNIISVVSVNGKKRYEVQDPEPDETGAPGEKFVASANSLIAIPSVEQDLPEYPLGKAVLARYPETTTFYRAEVIANLRKGVCKLRFEDDQNQEMEVARRFVLDLKQ